MSWLACSIKVLKPGLVSTVKTLKGSKLSKPEFLHPPPVELLPPSFAILLFGSTYFSLISEEKYQHHSVNVKQPAISIVVTFNGLGTMLCSYILPQLGVNRVRLFVSGSEACRDSPWSIGAGRTFYFLGSHSYFTQYPNQVRQEKFVLSSNMFTFLEVLSREMTCSIN